MPVSLPQAQPQWAHRFSAQPVDERAPTPDPPSLWASFVNQVAEFLTRLSGPSLRTAMVGSLVALLALVVVQFAQINPAELMGTVAAQPTGAVVITIAPPTGLTDVVTITTSNGHSLALKYDGTVVAWGDNSQEQATVPAGLTDVIAIAAGDRHSLALKRDGTVVAWGNNDYGQSNVPAGLREVTAIAAGRFHSLALKRNGTVVTWGNEPPGQFQLPGASATIP